MEDWTPTERQAAAREAYLASVADGTPLTGAELGRRFGRTDRWGRMQISKVRTERQTGNVPSPSPSDNGSEARVRASGSDHPTSREASGRNREAQTERRRPTPDVRQTETAVGVRNGAPSDGHLARATVPDRRAPGPGAVTPAGPGSQAAGTTPLALTVVRWLTTLTVVAIALAAGRASYDHQRSFAEMAGEDRNAWSLPLSVDGMMLVASLTMLVRRWQNKPAGHLAWAALLLGGLASLAANITVAEPTLAGRLAAAWPPSASSSPSSSSPTDPRRTAATLTETSSSTVIEDHHPGRGYGAARRW